MKESFLQMLKIDLVIIFKQLKCLNKNIDLLEVGKSELSYHNFFVVLALLFYNLHHNFK